MKKSNFLNVAQITSVRSYPKSKDNHYEYKKEERYLFFWKKPEGFYYSYAFSPYLVSETFIEKQGMYAEGEFVYWPPHAEIRMSDQSTHTKYFDTPELLE